MKTFNFKDLSTTQSYLLKAAHFFSNYLGTTLLFSNDGSPNSSSFLFLFPYEKITVDHHSQNPWGQLKKGIGNFANTDSFLPEWVGYLSYEMGAYSDSDFILPHQPSDFPLAYFQKFALTLIQKGSNLTLIIQKEHQGQLLDQALQADLFFDSCFWEDFFKEPLEEKTVKGSLLNQWDKENYESYKEKIHKALEWIKKGDIYEVNLSRSITYETDLPSFEIFTRLTELNPTQFSAFLNLDAFQILSASPEKFLSLDQGIIETRPIKGTASRGESLTTDRFQQQTLLNGAKEDAELMMICDLMRNDLGRISQIGSVDCLHIKKLLTLSNVFHLESVIQGKMLKMHPLDALRACFPAGSITGCPKIRSMQIIEALEKRPRHIYCGSIGYFKENGDFCFNVAIRTAVQTQKILELQLGGAITSDSNLQEEYEETQHKGSPFLDVLTQKRAKSIDFAQN